MQLLSLIHRLWCAQVLSACYNLASQPGLNSICHRGIVANHGAQQKEEIDDVLCERTFILHSSQGPCQQDVVNALFRSFEAIDTQRDLSIMETCEYFEHIDNMTVSIRYLQ